MHGQVLRKTVQPLHFCFTVLALCAWGLDMTLGSRSGCAHLNFLGKFTFTHSPMVIIWVNTLLLLLLFLGASGLTLIFYSIFR